MSASTAIARAPHGHFQKGAGSANPGGKPKAQTWNAAVMARELAAATNDFQEVRDFLLEVFRDKTRSMDERRWAVQVILDYGVGKPAQAIQLAGAVVHADAGTPQGDAITIAALVASGASDEDLATFERALAPLLGGGAIDAASVEVP